MNMGSSTIALAIIYFTGLAVVHVCRAQYAPADYVNAHNTERAELGLPPMTWNATLAAYALGLANGLKGTCELIHSDGPYGENLFEGSPDYTAADAVRFWIDDEKKYYDYGSNTCSGGQQCGHYTQIVWRDSVRLGCARVQCDTGDGLIACNYDPPGNVAGEKPY